MGTHSGLSWSLVLALLVWDVFEEALVAIETACGPPVEAHVSIYRYTASGPAKTEPEVRNLHHVHKKMHKQYMQEILVGANGTWRLAHEAMHKIIFCQ